MKNLTTLATGFALAGLLTGCLLEDKKETAKTASGEYVLAVTSATDGGTDYLLTVPSLDTGVISAAGVGIEQTGWRHMHKMRNLVFSVGYSDDHQFIAYKKDPAGTNLVEKGRFVFPLSLDVLADVSDGVAIAIEAPRKGVVPRSFFRIDLDAMTLGTKVPHSIYQTGTDSATAVVAWPTSMVHRDGKVFVAFYQVSTDGNFNVKNTDTAFVAVYSYPSFTFEKVIKDTRAGALGLFSNTTGLIKTASNDIYAYACASYACNTTDSSVTRSTILRIRSGSTDWDANYAFDFETATGKKLAWFYPIGGELALARAIPRPAAEDSGKIGGTKWSILSAFTTSLYILNLETKTATAVTGVPLHKGGNRQGAYVENSKVYVPVQTSATETHIYSIDIATAVGTQGAKVIGGGVKLIAR